MNGPFGLSSAEHPVAGPPVPAGEDDPNESLVQQLAGLYQEKQELQAALGVSTSAEVVALFETRQSESMVGSLTAQLAALYTEHDELRAALGVSTADEVIALVDTMRGAIRSLIDDARRRLDFEASLLDSHERFLV